MRLVSILQFVSNSALDIQGLYTFGDLLVVAMQLATCHPLQCKALFTMFLKTRLSMSRFRAFMQMTPSI